ncbi:MAG: hypothetical protein HYX47_23415 [Burkholderiales bacterium]|nr:hypothetical protein [Burkholderiales bacterium]
MLNNSCATVLAAVLLAGCGGGGSETTTVTVVTPAPVVPELTGSNGDLGKYASASWNSNCGVSFLSSNPLARSVYNTFSFGPATGSSVTGTLTTQYYTDFDCRTASVLTTSLGGSSIPIRVTFLSTVPVKANTPATAVGSADLTVLTTISSGATQSLSIGFVPGFTQFRTAGADANFSSSSLTYKK